MTSDREHPENRADPAPDLPRLEGQAEEAREKLADAERQAAKGVERAEQLEERAAELEEAGEELRRKAREPGKPLSPPPGPDARE